MKQGLIVVVAISLVGCTGYAGAPDVGFEQPEAIPMERSSGPPGPEAEPFFLEDCPEWRGGRCMESEALADLDDADGDGFTGEADCDDTDYAAHPGAEEIRCNEVDEDCDGEDLCFADADGDGVAADADCDDNDPTVSPLRPEIPCNELDENCDGLVTCDRDGDGHPAPLDCDDAEPTIHPMAADDPCDGVDQDCDGFDCCRQDGDGDGHPCNLDCDDRDPETWPGAPTPAGCCAKDLNCDGILDGFDCP